MAGPSTKGLARPASLAPSPSHKPKVIYIMGAGKSGSTILGVTLGNCADIFFAGELCGWLLNAGMPVLGGLERTRFWQDVSDSVDGASELFGSQTLRCIERASSLIRIDTWRTRWGLRERYRRVTEDLYRSIASRAGVTHVVDSSHLPLRAHELQSLSGIELYLVFLIRDAESVVASHGSHIKRHEVAERRWRFFMTNVGLWVTYLLSVIVFLRHRRDRRLLVRHEDFLADPQGVLREILDFAGSKAEIPDLAHLRTGIPLKGNPLIHSEVIALKAKPAPAHRPSRLMRLVQRPWTMVLARLGPVATGAGSREHDVQEIS